MEYKKNAINLCDPENLNPISGHMDIMITNLGLKDINPLLVGQYQCRPGHSYGPSIRHYYLIHYVVSGSGIYNVSGKTYNLKKGDMFVVRPNMEISYKACEQNPWHYRWVGFKCNSKIIPEFLNHDVVHAPEVDYIFRSIMNSDRFSNAKELYISSKIFELFALMAQKNEMKQNKPHTYVQIAKNFIESNYNDPRLSISILAKKLNLDRCYLSTIFKNSTGVSPREYLQDFRLNKSIHLLTHGDLIIEDVAYACGYNSGFHFSKMFRQKFGVSPSKYRKEALEKVAI